MRVGLNATCFNDRPSGAKQRFEGIYGKLIARRPDIDFIIYEPEDCAVGDWFAGAKNVLTRRTPIPSSGRTIKALRGLRYWRSALKHDRLDLFETFNLPLVRAPHCPTILTVHDIRPVRADVPWLRRRINGAVLRRSLRSADLVVTVSNTMRTEIRVFEPAAQVRTVYNGIDATLFAQAPADRLTHTRTKYGLSQDFILAVGHLEARKNYSRLIRAISRLKESGKPVSLVIVGNEGGAGQALRWEIQRLGLSGLVTILQGVSDSEMVDLYTLAELFVFPSCYEGFGIPILEAMAAQRPQVLSDTPVFRELTEDEGIYFPPEDVELIASAIENVRADEMLKNASIDYGNRRVAAFTFDALADQVGEIYNEFGRSSDHDS